MTFWNVGNKIHMYIRGSGRGFIIIYLINKIGHGRQFFGKNYGTAWSGLPSLRSRFLLLIHEIHLNEGHSAVITHLKCYLVNFDIPFWFLYYGNDFGISKLTRLHFKWIITALCPSFKWISWIKRGKRCCIVANHDAD